MTTVVRNLLSRPIVYEIVIGDFGRAAAIDYVRVACERERSLLRAHLANEGLPFFDEYRRIMFTLLGYVAYYKQALIDDQLSALGHLSHEVLIGGGMTPVSQDVTDRIVICVAQAVLAAVVRGYERIQLALPCNALSDLAEHVGSLLRSPESLSQVCERAKVSLPDSNRVLEADLSVRTVPEAVLRLISMDDGATPPVLLLGAEGALTIYERMSEAYAVEIIRIDPEEQKVIDEAVVASIGGEPHEVESCRERLRREVINPRVEEFGDVTVVEACTDFSFGLGLNSLEMFAEDLVRSCYGG
jgi:hypothetical protein